ncbi:MAG: hypothetical protein AAGB93_18220 [Planctomycetota bacterium]
MRVHLRELERAFGAFERGDVNRLYESRESLLGLSEAIESDGWYTLTPICEIASKLLGVVLMERGLSEARAVQVVRELLQYVEGEVARANESQGAVDPGGVFHIVNSQKVGELLVKRGLVSSEDLEKALVLQGVRRGRRVGEVLVAMNVIDQRTLDEVLEMQKAETRREETRRSSRPNAPSSGGPSISITAGSNAIPPVPGSDDSAPSLSLGGDGHDGDLSGDRDPSFDGNGGSLGL